MGLVGRIARLAEKGLEPDEKGNGKHQRIARNRNGRQNQRQTTVESSLVDPLLGDEAEEGRQPRH